jgi:D-3-phosphoglycerate dehydrogenase
MKTIVISDCDHDSVDIEKRILNQKDINFRLEQCASEDDVIEKCRDADVIINQYVPITRKVMENIPKLKMVIRYGVGVDNVDVDSATDLGIQICNVPDYGTNEVADHALALMLALTRKIVIMNNYTKNVKWDYVRAIPVRRISSLTVGVIGLGRIGLNFAGKAKALGCRIIGYDPFYKKTKQNEFVTQVTMDEILENSDVISIHCPLENNENLINRKSFKKMKNTSFIINAARGGIINEEDLKEAIENKEIAGAALDCLENEGREANRDLLKYENVIVTPHMAWYSEEAYHDLERKVAEESLKFVRGEKISYPVNHLKKVL